MYELNLAPTRLPFPLVRRNFDASNVFRFFLTNLWEHAYYIDYRNDRSDYHGMLWLSLRCEILGGGQA